jgi:hypothetical protein
MATKKPDESNEEFLARVNREQETPFYIGYIAAATVSARNETLNLRHSPYDDRELEKRSSWVDGAVEFFRDQRTPVREFR